MSEISLNSPALEFSEARRIVLETVAPWAARAQPETVTLLEAHGRWLAGGVSADRDYPALARSLRDGFAVKAADVPGTLRIRGEIKAGGKEEQPLHAGEAIEIMTGAPVPAGADAIVMVEHTVRSGDQVRIDRTAESGQFINERGAEAHAGTEIIARGTRLDGSHIAALAALGRASISVFTKPRVAILATGDEIVALHENPAPHQIRNSNSFMLASLVAAAGGEPTILPTARDTKESLLPLLRQGLTHDLLIVTGGVSAGKYDLVKPALRELGVTIRFERVLIQPGAPVTFGVTSSGKPVFGLPGNPGSSLITFQLFARAALELLAGARESVLPLLTARFEAPFQHKGGLLRFLPARLSANGQQLRHISWQGSSDVPALAKSNCFLMADADRLSWAIGDTIRVMMKL